MRMIGKDGMKVHLYLMNPEGNVSRLPSVVFCISCMPRDYLFISICVTTICDSLGSC